MCVFSGNVEVEGDISEGTASYLSPSKRSEVSACFFFPKSLDKKDGMAHATRDI